MDIAKIIVKSFSLLRMNQLIANKLNEEGAIILILEMQVGAEIGLDYNSWLVGKEFMGFKMVNPGFHCLFYR
jgi:uncharacterized protein C20orf4 homolog